MTLELQPIKRQDIEVGKPLRWNVYDKDHKLLLKQGAVIRSETQLDVLGRQGLYSSLRERSGLLRAQKVAPDAHANQPKRPGRRKNSFRHASSHRRNHAAKAH
jgi:hypothetical protein